MGKISLKKLLLDDGSDDELESVVWNDDKSTSKKYFNCGCCDECLCDDNIECLNCGCNCNCDEFEDDYDIENDSEESESEQTITSVNKPKNNVTNFDINIVENNEKEKKVRITLKLNVSLNNEKKETINIDLDINKTTYLKIAEELFK